MVSSQFESLLKEFETFFKCPLQPDQNDSCLIKMGIGISIQLELNRQGLVLIGCRLAVVPMSRYRDNLIREALKSNEATLPSTGILGFSKKSNQLILFMSLNPLLVNSDLISTVMPPFIAKAKLWAEAIMKGEVPAVTQQTSTATSGGIFGLIP
jgi:hypothetical protein